jgi:hypothetical protein
VTSFAARITTTPSGAVQLDHEKETLWNHWVHYMEILPEKFGVVRNASTQNRDQVQGSVNWSKNGALSGGDPNKIFSSTVLPLVEAYINEGPGSTVWTPVHNAGFYWTDNNGVGGNPSNYIFHEAFYGYTFHQLSFVTTIIRCEGTLLDPPFQWMLGKTVLFHATGVAFTAGGF